MRLKQAEVDAQLLGILCRHAHRIRLLKVLPHSAFELQVGTYPRTVVATTRPVRPVLADVLLAVDPTYLPHLVFLLRDR